MGQRGQAQTLTPAQQRTVLSVINSHSRFIQRDRAIFCLSFFAGMRVGEIAQLTIGDLAETDKTSGTLTVREVVSLTKTKGSKTREVYLVDPELRNELQTYLDQEMERDNVTDLSRHLFVTKSGKPFTSITLNQVFRRFYDLAGYTKAKSHSGRRTYITTLAEKGFNLHHLSILAGHSSVQTTARYVDANPETLKKIAVHAVSDEISRDLRKSRVTAG